MMTMPPTTTRRDAQLSSRIRRLVRAPETTSGRAEGTGPPAVRVSVPMATYWTLLSSSFAMEAGMGK